MLRAKTVALVQMPFAVTAWPSLGLSMLKAVLVEKHFAATIHYFNKDFAEKIGADLYEKISNGAPQNVDLAGEWAFSSCLWGRHEESDASYVREVLQGRHPAHTKPTTAEVVKEVVARLDEVVGKTSAFLDDCVASVDWANVDVVGFTSIFQQHVASLALAKRLKATHDHLRIVFGGANCEAEMGVATLRNFDFVDAICLGEGDEAFPEYLEALAGGRDDAIPGMLRRQDLVAASPPRLKPRTSVDLNALPYPDFDDFFRDAPVDDQDYASKHRLIFESSRGCWWGQKNHCTFCGLNGNSMGFRQKTGARATQELKFLVAKYGRYTRFVTATDNIMPYNYFEDFLPELAASGLKINLFYETKANLRKHQLEMYRDAGLVSIQPGIESLSSDVLKIMRKGITSLQNIQLLKWCREMGILAKWNFLAGFPGEDPRSYAPIGAMARKLTHLTPPIGVSTLRFDRFSPYHVRPSDHDVTRLDPYPAYQHVYRGMSASDVAQIAYYFVADFPGCETVDTYTASAFDELNRWKAYAPLSALFHIDAEAETIVFDARGDEARIYRLSGSIHEVFSRCDGITARPGLGAEDDDDVDGSIATLQDLGLFLEEDGRHLNLSIPLGREYAPPPGALRKLELLYCERDARDDGVAEEISVPPGNIIDLSGPTARREMRDEHARQAC